MTLVRSKPKGLLFEPRFARLWFGHLVSLAGDQIFPIALVAIAISRSDSPATTISVIFAARFLALGGLILIAGVIADRVDRTRLMIILDLLRAGVVGVFVFAGSGTPLWVLAVLTFAVGAGEALFIPLYESIIPEIVSEHQLERANGYSNAVRHTAAILGPALAGVLVLAVGAHTALAVDVLSFGVSAASIASIRRLTRDQLARRPAHDTGPPESMLRSGMAGLRLAVRMRWLLGLEIVAVVHILLAVGPFYVLLPVIASTDGGVGSYGLLLGVFGAGGTVGALAGGAVRVRRPGVVGLFGIASFALACLALGVRLPLVLMCLLFFVSGAGIQLFGVFKKTAIQRAVPRDYLGRIVALDWFASFVMMPLGQVLAGVVAVHIRPQPIMLMAAAVIAVTSLLPLLIPGTSTLGRREPDHRAGPASGGGAAVPATPNRADLLSSQ
jgi:predicted MFS family arabinose efflux permease